MTLRYVQIEDLAEADDNEEVYACYPNSLLNVSGKKSEARVQTAAKDAAAGNCKLLVRRELNESFF